MADHARLSMRGLFGSALQRTSYFYSAASIVIFCFLAALIPLANASPVPAHAFKRAENPVADPEDPGLWVYMGTAAALVLLGGAFAGLTIAYVSLTPTAVLEDGSFQKLAFASG
jgi:hypothetical protein